MYEYATSVDGRGRDLVCPCSFYQTAFQELAWPNLDGDGGREGGRREGLASHYQIIVGEQLSSTQIEKHNCQIRKHVVMQQWNEIDRRQETERGGEEGGWSYCYLSDSSAESAQGEALLIGDRTELQISMPTRHDPDTLYMSVPHLRLSL